MIAHPDDESMFFLPTIFTLCSKSDLHLLCLSTGNADGKGSTRIRELEKCCKEILKIETFHVVDDERLKDGMKEKWEPDVISSIVKSFCEQYSIEEVILYF